VAPRAAAVAPEDRAVDEAGRRFLEGYVEPDGRVVRRDQGGDTVSEGQAYALLVAVALGDRQRFDAIWSWTRAELQRSDGLLAWRWADGAVVDDEPAADADLDAAWALAVADQRWRDGGYGEAAAHLAAAIERGETAAVGDGAAVLLAGPWARGEDAAGTPHVVNPSYASPLGEVALVRAGATDAGSPDARRAGARAVLSALLDQRGVPTDWARVAPGSGSVTPADGPTEPGDGRFGWDAVRVPLRFAPSCDAADRALAARVWEPMRAGAGVEAMGEHPARLVGAAAAAGASGDVVGMRDLLDRASESDRRRPTYYGSALTALGRILLGTDRLGGCPPD
jgi:endoglucanase